MSVTYVFQPGGTNELTLDSSNLVNHNPVLTHTGKADLRATFEERRDLEQYAQRQDRVNVKLNGTTKWTGFVVGLNHNQKRATTTVRADGIGKRLEETRPDYDTIGGPVTYQSIALDEAIRDYWGRTPFTASVTDQTTQTVSNNETLQSADTTSEWQNVTTIANDTPLEARNGNLELLQSCFTTEGENPDDSVIASNATPSNEGDYSNGDYAPLTRDSAAGGPDYVEYNFSLDYTIPSGDFSFQYRVGDGGAQGDAPAYKITLQHANGNTYTIDEVTTVGFNVGSLGWLSPGLSTTYSGPDLTAGNYTVRIEVTDSNGTADEYVLFVDAIAPYDTRYSYFFDNDNGGSGGYLDGPELYPDSLTFDFDVSKTAYNIESGTINSTWDDTSNNQALALSNDNGQNYTSSSNTSSLTVDFTDAGRSAISRFTFSRYGSRTTATPQTGFNGQLVQDYTLTADLNDLVVIDKLDLTRNHFDNLKTLHEYGDFLWVIEHGDSSIGNLTVSSFQRGDETRSAPSEWDVPVNERPEVAAESYFNSIYLEGALDDQGNRPTAEVSDQTAINNDGRKISPGVLRDPSITTEAGAVFRANALLQTALQNNDLVGTLEAPPTDLIPPGYARGVDFDNDGTKEEKTVEEVSLSQSSGELREVIQFVVREDFARDINELRRNAKELGNQV